MARRWLPTLRSDFLRRRWVKVTAVSVASVVLLAILAAHALDGPLRGRLEERLNANLKGYTVRLGAVDFHPLTFSLDLIDAVLTQDAHPDPPVAHFPRFTLSVHWRALLSARLVGDVEIDRPTLHVDLRQVQREIEDETPVTDRGWQEALQAIYPLKINLFRVRDGRVTYIDRGPFKPLELHEVDLRATNIRNVRSRERTYPSEVRLTARVFEHGRLDVNGHADFLSVPHMGLHVNLALERLDVGYLAPIAQRYRLRLDRGAVSLAGALEFAPTVKVVDVEQARIDGLRAEYVHTAAARTAEKQGAAAAARTAREVSDAPGMLFRIQRLDVADSTFGVVNRAAARPFRLFTTDTDITVTGLSNRREDGEGDVRLKGRFMGTGALTARARFRPDPRKPMLDLRLQVEDTELTALNDLLAAYGKFDVAAGRFSLFSEVRVENDRIRGYVKPLFQDVQAYDERQDRDKNAFRKLYERVMTGVASLLENRPRDEVATRVELSGRLDDPNVGTLEAVVRLLENAFIKAILPGFERQLSRSNRKA